MEQNQEKRGIVKRTCGFIANHVLELTIAALGIVGIGCTMKSTKNTIVKQNEITDMQREEHEERMKLYEKAKYSDNTNVNINL